MVQEAVLAVSSTSVIAFSTLGSTLCTYKLPNAAANESTKFSAAASSDSAEPSYSAKAAIVEPSNGTNGFVVKVSGREGRRLLNIWSLAKAQAIHHVALPPKIGTIAVSKSGTYLAAGSSEGQVLLWEMSSGSLLAVIDAHFRAVTVISFTDDEAALVSASEDGIASVWSIGSILNATSTKPVSPQAVLSDHTLGITALQIGVGAFPQCRILTASKDCTCKLWDLSTGSASLLLTVTMPQPVSHIALDPMERCFYAVVSGSIGNSTAEGASLLRVDLVRDLILTVDNVDESNVYHLQDSVASMSLSPVSQTLFVGGKSVYLLALPALRPVRIISNSLDGSPVSDVIPYLNSTASTYVQDPVLLKAGLQRSLRDANWNQGGKNGRLVYAPIMASHDVLKAIRPDENDVHNVDDLLSARPLDASFTSVSAAQNTASTTRSSQEADALRSALDRAIALNARLLQVQLSAAKTR